MVDRLVQVFTRHENNITRIRSHVHGEEIKLAKKIIGYGANSLYFYCLGDAMPCGKDMLVVNEKSFDQKRIANFLKDVVKGKENVFFGFAQVDIKVLDGLYEEFSEMALLSVVQEIPDCNIFGEIKLYKEKNS